ncbi:hypothetical protein [Chryseobacterium carnipullorum]|uniref:Uncharacterized protein n=1 Tax=Chryseobacterium carnipullorum TaxID=1124835 RepID=A0A376E4D8_CHRCU|nr:hypothetical protein [Chryseobacterium carnipullorum]STD01120.1 Uncharacterised protein [Chryseobacterium carnipullorum]
MMKKKLLLTGFFITFSLVVKSQVGINTANPQGIFSVDGLKNNPSTGTPTITQAKDDLVMTSNGNLGLGLTAPGTTLDVNGAITNRETALIVAGNTVTIPSNVSLIRLTGAATAAVAITAPAAPNAGQRLIVYNNTTGDSVLPWTGLLFLMVRRWNLFSVIHTGGLLMGGARAGPHRLIFIMQTVPLRETEQ